MYRHPILKAGCILVVAGVTAPGSVLANDIYQEVYGRIGLESRWYPEDPLDGRQESSVGGLVLQPTLYVEDDNGRSFTVTPFLRYDSADHRRTHADLREAYLLLFGDFRNSTWELRLGVDQVFWGVAESRHLVDIINQIDLIEHPNEESKLGQPMAHATWSTEWGVLEFFGLPYHRARTFPGTGGRLRGQLVIDDERVTYESGAEEWHLDAAARFSQSFGPVDIGVSVFEGTSRDPSFIPPSDARGLLTQYYEQIRQFGLDSQLTLGSWLWKLEAIQRNGFRNLRGEEEDYAAFVAGGEYTFYSVWGTPADVGVIGEWNFDERGDAATNVFQNDVFVGARVALNDTASTDFIVGLMADLDHGTPVLSLEFNRRLSNNWALNVEGFAFPRVPDEDFLNRDIRNDSFLNLSLNYNF